MFFGCAALSPWLARSLHSRSVMNSTSALPRLTIEPVALITDEIVAAMELLIQQLGDVPRTPGRSELEQIAASSATTLLIARDGNAGNRIVGSLTLVIFNIPSGIRAIIEDVVVDAETRGAGIGSALVLHAIGIAQERGARKVDLTSRPDRVEANRLYPRLGFVKRDTNVYRYKAGAET